MAPEPCNYATAHASVLLDELADLGRGLLQATAALSEELLQAYGYPESGSSPAPANSILSSSHGAIPAPSRSGRASAGCCSPHAKPRTLFDQRPPGTSSGPDRVILSGPAVVGQPKSSVSCAKSAGAGLGRGGGAPS
jgi:hypothetical protein